MVGFWTLPVSSSQQMSLLAPLPPFPGSSLCLGFDDWSTSHHRKVPDFISSPASQLSMLPWCRPNACGTIVTLLPAICLDVGANWNPERPCSDLHGTVELPVGPQGQWPELQETGFLSSSSCLLSRVI